MKRFALIFVLCLPGVASAQEDSGLSMMERGAQLFFEGLLNEMEPALDEMQNFAESMGPGLAQMMDQMGPAFADLMERIDDLSNYEPPVMLPNGDIIIRRKPEAPELSGPVDI